MLKTFLRVFFFLISGQIDVGAQFSRPNFTTLLASIKSEHDSRLQQLGPARIYTRIVTPAPDGTRQFQHPVGIMHAQRKHNKPRSHCIPPHDFILGVGIMASVQDTLPMTSVWIGVPLRYHKSGWLIGRKAPVEQMHFACVFVWMLQGSLCAR